jgi:transcriptional regulator with XRE-family HTH domain
MDTSGQFGRWLRQTREGQQVGLRALAEKMGISPTFLSRVETGAEPCPPAEPHLRVAATVLGVDADEVVVRARGCPVDVAGWLQAEPTRIHAVRRLMVVEAAAQADRPYPALVWRAPKKPATVCDECKTKTRKRRPGNVVRCKCGKVRELP